MFPAKHTPMLIRENNKRVVFLQHAGLTKRYMALSIGTMQDHELNDLMDGTLPYISLATGIVEQEKHEMPREYLVRCRQDLMRMIQILSELLEFSRGSHIPLEYANVEQIIEDALSTVGSKAESSNIRILRDYARGTPSVRNDNLFQVFCNIIKNAFDVMPNNP